MRRTERLFAMAEYLRGRRTGVTAEDLAERFGVTIRTVYRDLDSLRDASLPLHAERGRGGGYALDKAYSLPPVNFMSREAAVLVTAGSLLLRMRLLPLVDTLSSALDKVRAALPTDGQRELARLHGEELIVCDDGIVHHGDVRDGLTADTRADQRSGVAGERFGQCRKPLGGTCARAAIENVE